MGIQEQPGTVLFDSFQIFEFFEGASQKLQEFPSIFCDVPGCAMLILQARSSKAPAQSGTKAMIIAIMLWDNIL